MPRKFKYNPNSNLSAYQQAKKVFPRIGGLPKIPDNASKQRISQFIKLYTSAQRNKSGCKSCG